MAKKNNKGRSKSGPPFVMLFYYIMDSDAWRGLNPASRAVLMQIARRYNGSNNGFLGASVRDLSDECNIAIGTVTASLKTLEAVGFIVTVRKGGFSCKVRLASEYRLTWLKCDLTGHAASNNFRAYQSAQANKKAA